MAADMIVGRRRCAALLSDQKQQQLAVVVVVASVLLCSSWMACVAEASCRVENQSGQPVALLPVAGVETGVAVSIDVAVGASVDVPSPQQTCYLQNPSSGHQVGPVTLPDSLVVIVDGAIEGTVDIHVATLLDAVLTIGVRIVIAL